MDAYLLRIGYVKSFANPNLYIKVVNNEPVILLLYVDDLFIIGVERKMQEDAGSEIQNERSRTYALLLGFGSLAKTWRDIFRSR